MFTLSTLVGIELVGLLVTNASTNIKIRQAINQTFNVTEQYRGIIKNYMSTSQHIFIAISITYLLWHHSNLEHNVLVYQSRNIAVIIIDPRVVV